MLLASLSAVCLIATAVSAGSTAVRAQRVLPSDSCPPATTLMGTIGDRVWCEDSKGRCHGPWFGWESNRLIAAGTYDRGRPVGLKIGWPPQFGLCSVRYYHWDGSAESRLWRKDGTPFGYAWQTYPKGPTNSCSIHWDEAGLLKNPPPPPESKCSNPRSLLEGWYRYCTRKAQSPSISGVPTASAKLCTTVLHPSDNWP